MNSIGSQPARLAAPSRYRPFSAWAGLLVPQLWRRWAPETVDAGVLDAQDAGKHKLDEPDSKWQ